MNLARSLATALFGLAGSLLLAPGAQATGDVWIEGSYEFLDLPNVRFIDQIVFDRFGTNAIVREEFRNDDGDFDGFRIDGGIADIPMMGGSYMVGVKGFFAWHDDSSELQCVNNGTANAQCRAIPLIDNTAVIDSVSASARNTSQYETDRDVDHWGVALEVARGPMGLKAGPAFRRIDQDLTITGRVINQGPVIDLFQLTYQEDLETNYWGAFVGADGSIDLGGGWSLQGDAEAGLYWADIDYSGNYVVTNAVVAAGFNGNTNQQLSLESDELAFIGVMKGSLEKDFGMFKLAGFGRVEYISSAPDVAYNDQDIRLAPLVRIQGPEDETRLGERFAYTASVGARVTVPMGGQ